MSDEQYERLFAISLQPRRFATIDGSLLTRGLIDARDLYPARRQSSITPAGIARLRERLDFAATLQSQERAS